MPALPLDVALLHLNRADERGNAQFLGPDLYMDDLFASAADKTFVSCEKVVPTAELTPFHTLRINRLQVDGVVEAPGGAGFTSCQPDYERDEEAQKAYAVDLPGPRGLDRLARRLERGMSDADPGRGVLRRRGRVLPGRRRDPGQPHRHHPDDRRPPGPGHLRARAGHDRRLRHARRRRPRRSAPRVTPDLEVEGWNPYRTMFDVVWGGGAT